MAAKQDEEDLFLSFLNEVKDIGHGEEGQGKETLALNDGDDENPRKRPRILIAESKVIARASHSSAKEDESNFLKELKNGLDEDLSFIFSKQNKEPSSLFITQGVGGDSVVSLSSVAFAPTLVTQSLITSSSSSSRHQTASNSSGSKKNIRMSGDEIWEDPTLSDWPDNDYRLFVTDLAPEVTSDQLAQAFSSDYPSFARARVIRDKYSNQSKGFGFVSYLDPLECIKAMRECRGKYIGSRPVRIEMSNWKDRNINTVRSKQRNEKKLKKSLNG